VGTNELPGTKDVASFLELMEQIIDSNSWSTMHNLLQTQYATSDYFSWRKSGPLVQFHNNSWNLYYQ
jgi:hypothetical protein